MEPRNELAGGWFDKGDQLAGEVEERFEPAPPPNLMARFMVALAGAAVVIGAIITVARALV